MVVCSKWGYTYTADWKIDAEAHEVKEHSLAVLQRQRRESQSNLGLYLDLYQIHSATIESGVLENWDGTKKIGGYHGKLAGFRIESGQIQRYGLDNFCRAAELYNMGFRSATCL